MSALFQSSTPRFNPSDVSGVTKNPSDPFAAGQMADEMAADVAGLSMGEFRSEVNELVEDLFDDAMDIARRTDGEGRAKLVGAIEQVQKQFHEHTEAAHWARTNYEEFEEPPRDNPSGDHLVKLREADGRRYQEGYRRVQNEFREGIDALYGVRASEGPQGGRTELVSVYYDAGAFTPDDAIGHAQRVFGDEYSGLSVEPADGDDAARENPGGGELPSQSVESSSRQEAPTRSNSATGGLLGFTAFTASLIGLSRLIPADEQSPTTK